MPNDERDFWLNRVRNDSAQLEAEGIQLELVIEQVLVAYGIAHATEMADLAAQVVQAENAG